MKVLIAGGGTGGHVYLGIALARELARREPACAFLFVGTRRGLETRIVPQEGFRLECIDSAGLKGMGALNLIRNLTLIPGSLLQSRLIVRGFDPAVSVGVGGYSSGPAILASWWLGKPTLIVEPNAHPGLTNRWLARIVNRAALALPDDVGYFGKKGVVTGIPVREEFHRVPARTRRAPFTLLIYGGSQGSHALNSIVREALADLKTLGAGFQVIHQTGEKEYAQIREAYSRAGMNAEVHAFLPRIFEEFGRADLILSRAGAGTIAELTVAGKAAILVPFPGAADDHQTRNALALEMHGAAKMIPEDQWGPGRLVSEVRHFLDYPDVLVQMEKSARALARPDAARDIAGLVEQLAGSRS